MKARGEDRGEEGEEDKSKLPGRVEVGESKGKEPPPGQG